MQDETVEVIDSDFYVTHTVEHVLCNSDLSGVINLQGHSGVPPYEFKLSTDAEFASANKLSNLAAGTYIVNARDSRSCVIELPPIIITEPTLLAPVATPTESTLCFGTTGSLSLTVGGGVSPYTISLDGVDTVPFEGASKSWTSIPPGAYNVTVIDSNSCKKLVPVTYTELDELIGTRSVHLDYLSCVNFYL